METGFGIGSESKYGHEDRSRFVYVTFLAFLGFAIPFTFGHPQLLVGVLVNALLVWSSLRLPLKMTLPVVFTPVLGVLARGLLFGPFTSYLALMAPFIWIGNLILVYAFKSERSFIFRLLSGSLAKAGFLYASALLLNMLGLVPEALLTAMGIVQLATALGGGLLACSAVHLKK